jgi:malate dehydrogenase (oxaloacetate-decarboxylating)
LDCQAREINDPMLFAAANAIAQMVTEEELSEDYIIPSVLNKRVPERVATYVKEAAIQTGVAELKLQYLSSYRSV